MSKQFSWMYTKAILKIIIPILLIVFLVFMVIREDMETVEIVVVCGLWGIAALIYIVSGILTLKNGPKQARKYIREYPAGAEALDEEYEKTEEFGGLKIGHKHAFANSSDGFHILPFESIEKVYVRHHGENKAKGRPGYYYLYISATLPDWTKTIKVYYMTKGEASDAEAHLLERCRL